MSSWNTDKIIGAGLIVALLCYIAGFYTVAAINGTILPLDVASNIVTGLAGYMGRSLLEKKKFDDEMKNNEKEGNNDENIS